MFFRLVAFLKLVDLNTGDATVRLQAATANNNVIITQCGENTSVLLTPLRINNNNNNDNNNNNNNNNKK